MRFPIIVLTLVACAIGTGCIPPATQPADTGVIGLVAGITETNPAPSDTPSSSAAAPDPPSLISGSVGAAGEYELFELGPGLVGDSWTIADDHGSTSGHSFVLALLDSNYELLRRDVLTTSKSLTHILRADAQALYVGITPTLGTSGGDFRLKVSRLSGLAVPAPSPQVVWLNFGGGTNVSVHARAGIDFATFDASMLGPQFAGETEALKTSIVAAMREDYAPYNVLVLTSDDGPPPDGPYATVHFGGDDNRLLGLADNVDQYNSDPWQVAVVYVDSFANYSTMRLTAPEMGQMVGNVASHEFGHLLGLFHTQVPKDVMDTTGTAWDLVANQAFLTADLEQSVFPFGRENCPQRLAETVGRSPSPPENSLAKDASSLTMSRKASLRALARDMLRGHCGTCLDLDN